MVKPPEFNISIASHFIELQANESPDKEILIFEKGEHGEDTLTYKDLYVNSNKLARFLLHNGIGKGDTFVSVMRNHPQFVYSLLAGITIGAIMVPVDPRTKADMLKFLVNSSLAKAIIVSGECLEQVEMVIKDIPAVKLMLVAYIAEQGTTVSRKYPSLNEILENMNWNPVEQQISDVQQPMQIIYTSGTTGEPKGVMIRNHRTGLYNIMSKVVWKYQDNDVLYTGLSMTHGNAQTVTLFPALYTGIKAVFSTKFTKSRIWDICRKYGCTSFSLLGGMMPAIYNEPPKPDDKDNPVRLVLSAGTPVSIWEAFEKRFNVQILEWYAAVEGGLAFKPVGEGPIGSFGRAMPGIMEMKVVDQYDNELPPGVTGELIIQFAAGETKVDYHNKPEESREKTRGGWLRTGDMVHRDKEGWLFFDFRKGTELRRSGDFIQPQYLEAVIGKQPDVSEVCVYGIPSKTGAPGESDIVAAIQPFNGRSIDPRLLYFAIKKELPANYLPTFLQIVEEIPRTTTEKYLDRKLKDMFAQGEGKIYKYDDYKPD